MTNDKRTFAALDRFLRDLGFTRTAEPKGFVFYHKPSKAAIFLRKFADDEELSPTDRAIVRHHLDWYGLMPSAEFERRFSTRSLVV